MGSRHAVRVGCRAAMDVPVRLAVDGAALKVAAASSEGAEVIGQREAMICGSSTPVLAVL